MSCTQFCLNIPVSAAGCINLVCVRFFLTFFLLMLLDSVQGWMNSSSLLQARICLEQMLNRLPCMGIAIQGFERGHFLADKDIESNSELF